MKVLNVSPYNKPAYVYGGPIVSIGSLVNQLEKQGVAVTVLTTNANGANLLECGKQSDANVYVFPLTIRAGFFSWALIKQLWRTVDSFDVVHIHCWWNLTSILGVCVCWMKGIKPVFSTRGMLSAYSFAHSKSFVKKAFHHTVGRFLLSKTILHATSHKELNECLSIIPDWTHFVAPNIIDLPSIALQQRISNSNLETLHCVFLSRIHPVKGLELLFEALSRISIPFRLRIVGKGEAGYVQSLKTLAQNLNIDQRIEWLDWADNDRKYALFAEADLSVQPSLTENFANSILEALSVGTPVLVSNQVGLCEYVAENDLGWVAALSVENIAQALEQAYHDTEKRARIRNNAPKKVQEDFSPQTVTQSYIRQYQKLAQR